MQQLGEFNPTWYFAIGSPEKTSLCSQFCRENNFLHFVNPKVEDLPKGKPKHAIIEGSLDFFKEVQKIKPELSLILVGKPGTDAEKHLCQEYEKIGRLKTSPTYKYQQFRKKLFPNIIFIYGPIAKQNKSIAITLSKNISYVYVQLAKDANQYISHLDLTQNYVVNGLFEDSKQIRIMSEYFEIRVAHLKYNRVDLPNQGNYFDKQFQLVNFLKDKNYYFGVNGAASQAKVLDQIGNKTCPRLIYINQNSPQEKAYLEKYIQQSGDLLLNLEQIQIINKRKNIPLPSSAQAKSLYLSALFYRDLNRKQIVLSYYPWILNEVLALQNINRKIQAFVDLSSPDQYKYNKAYSTPIYFLESQKLFHPNKQNSLINQLKPKVEYWLITGPVGAGKTSVAKYLSSQFGFKHIEFQPYLASVKEKLMTPEDGQELPVKKAIEHFRQLLHNDKASVYAIDGLPYVGKDLQTWLSVVGIPNVINLDVQVPEQIKRCRRKAQSDLAAQVNQQQSNKAKDSTDKNKAWIDSISNLAPSAKVYKVDYNQPQIKVQNSIKKILRPRIFLIQKNSTHLYQNIAIRYNLGFVNLNKFRLRECQDEVKNTKKRDIILCNHGHEKKRIPGQDLYWIQKNLGEIRYLGIWQNEQKQHHPQKLELERPQAPEKPKPAEGEAGEQKPPEDPPAEGGEANKKKFDIYDYEWSKPGDSKNLSQWFFKSKHHITQFQHTPEDCFNNFKKVLDKLNQSPENNVYQKIK